MLNMRNRVWADERCRISCKICSVRGLHFSSVAPTPSSHSGSKWLKSAGNKVREHSNMTSDFKVGRYLGQAASDFTK